MQLLRYLRTPILSGSDIAEKRREIAKFSRYESLCSTGVDEMSWDDLDDTHYEGPTVEEVKAYRNQDQKSQYENESHDF